MLNTSEHPGNHDGSRVPHWEHHPHLHNSMGQVITETVDAVVHTWPGSSCFLLPWVPTSSPDTRRVWANPSWFDSGAEEGLNASIGGFTGTVGERWEHLKLLQRFAKQMHVDFSLICFQLKAVLKSNHSCRPVFAPPKCLHWFPVLARQAINLLIKPSREIHLKEHYLFF